MLNTHNQSQHAAETQALQESRRGLNDQQLYNELGRYYQTGQLEQAKLLQAFIDQKNQPSSAENGYGNFGGQYQEVEKKLTALDEEYQEKLDTELKAAKAANPKLSAKETEAIMQRNALQKLSAREAELKKFFEQDMKGFVSTIGGHIDTLRDAKDREIGALKDQLSGIVSQ